MPVTEITNRCCLDITGEDAKSFLQGMVTNDLALLDDQPALYACLLSPQGKFLHDFLMTKRDDGYRLEVLKEQAEILIKRLKLYKLRAKVTFQINEAQKIYAGWAESEMPDGGYRDPRLENLGWRLISDAPVETTAEFSAYDLMRIKAAVPDGSRDLTQELSTIYEGNIDLLNGVAYEKGCYMGQELTARMYYRGLIKKRLFPIKADSSELTTGEEVLRNGRFAGKIGSTVDNWGLVCLKTADIETPYETASGIGLSIIRPEQI